MKRTEIYEKLLAVFQEVFSMGELTIGDDTTSEDIQEWDSLSHIQMVVAVEKAFGIKFSSREIMGWKNVGEMVDSIAAKR